MMKPWREDEKGKGANKEKITHCPEPPAAMKSPSMEG
jgi:hypothetical protein